MTLLSLVANAVYELFGATAPPVIRDRPTLTPTRTWPDETSRFKVIPAYFVSEPISDSNPMDGALSMGFLFALAVAVCTVCIFAGAVLLTFKSRSVCSKAPALTPAPAAIPTSATAQTTAPATAPAQAPTPTSSPVLAPTPVPSPVPATAPAIAPAQEQTPTPSPTPSPSPSLAPTPSPIPSTPALALADRCTAEYLTQAECSDSDDATVVDSEGSGIETSVGNGRDFLMADDPVELPTVTALAIAGTAEFSTQPVCGDGNEATEAAAAAAAEAAQAEAVASAAAEAAQAAQAAETEATQAEAAAQAAEVSEVQAPAEASRKTRRGGRRAARHKKLLAYRALSDAQNN
ncbi:hypothetical protein LPJ73_001534 [Coemansia sp. RSA 2703]|nr:hypothetical protein LPJ73_001534 [Coemansia sp. RSA 2703]